MADCVILWHERLVRVGIGGTLAGAEEHVRATVACELVWVVGFVEHDLSFTH